jgi:hypothetical protein
LEKQDFFYGEKTKLINNLPKFYHLNRNLEILTLDWPQRLNGVFRQNYQSLLSLPEFAKFRLQSVHVQVPML